MVNEKFLSLYKQDPRAWWYARLVFVPTLCWNFLLGRILRVRRWWDRVDDHVILGALPFPGDAKRLKELGVTGVVNTCDEYSGPKKAYRKAEIEQMRMRTTDFTHPTLANVQRAIAFMEEQVAHGGQVYVHCKAGRGRSATVVVCWLMKRYGLTPEQAQQRLVEIRPHINRGLAERPVVRDFYQSLQRPDEASGEG